MLRLRSLRLHSRHSVLKRSSCLPKLSFTADECRLWYQGAEWFSQAFQERGGDKMELRECEDGGVWFLRAFRLVVERNGENGCLFVWK